MISSSESRSTRIQRQVFILTSRGFVDRCWRINNAVSMAKIVADDYRGLVQMWESVLQCDVTLMARGSRVLIVDRQDC
jgi:hypothetical protein